MIRKFDFSIKEASWKTDRDIIRYSKCIFTILIILFSCSIISSILIYQNETGRFTFEHASDQVLLYDEILTNSATMAAHTGELNWKRRYLEIEKKLGEELKYINQFSDESAAKYILEVEAANNRLVAIERQVFELVENKKLIEAQKLVSSDLYLINKETYSNGFSRFLNHQKEVLKARHRVLSNISIVSICMGLIFIFFTLWYARIIPKIINRLKNKNKDSKTRVLELMQYIASTPVSIAFFDKEVRYLAWSQKWIDDYNLEGVDLHNKSHYEVFNDISDEWKTYHQKVLRGETIKSDEDYFQLNDGSDYWLSYIVTPWYDENNEIGGLVMVTENITDRKLAEKRIIHQSKLASMGAMLGTISHEIKNPLTVINGGSTLIESYINSNEIKKDKILKLNKSIQIASSRILNLIEKLRVGIRSEEDSVKEELDFNHILYENIQLNEIVFSKENIHFESQIECEQLPILGDANELSQVIINLIMNAKDAVLDQEIRSVTVKTKKSEDSFIFSVIDNGPGIPEEIQPRIFEQYFTTKGKWDGTGIGLHLVEKIIRSHRGEISFETSSKGTTFKVKFPLGNQTSEVVVA